MSIWDTWVCSGHGEIHCGICFPERVVNEDSGLEQALNELLAENPEVEGPLGPRRLATLGSDSEGYCGGAEEVVGEFLAERGFNVSYADLHKPGLGWFSTHYVTVVDDEVIVDFTAAQIPGYEPESFPVVLPFFEYLKATGLELLEDLA